MCEGRRRDGGSALHAWTEPEVLVVCPRCSSRAVVRPSPSGRRLTCSACGLARETPGTTSVWGEPFDPWFRAPLWLRAELRGHAVWAFNDRHLEALRADVDDPGGQCGNPIPQCLALAGPVKQSAFSGVRGAG